MTARTKQGKTQEFPLESLYGGKAASNTIVHHGMADLEKQLARQFRDERAIEKEASKHLRKTYAPLIDLISRDDRAAAGIQGLREIDSRLGAWKLEPPSTIKEEQRIFSGSIGATVSPPYNYPWTFSASSGDPSISTTANSDAGQMSIDIWNNTRDASGIARAALGIYFRPMTANGILRLSSSPAFNYDWWTNCAMASAHSDAFIGLYVGRYNLSGGFDGAPVNQVISLWSDDSWWTGAGAHRGTNSGYPLFAQFNVDRSHWYALWVWCGGRATAAGWGMFTGSGAGSRLSVTVPSITWELF